MDRDEYQHKILNMLTDINVYTRTDVDDTVLVKAKADELILELHEKGLLNFKQVNNLTKFKPRCPIFYGLPKVHKENWPLRPIVSQIDGPTSRINALVDKYLYVAEKNIPYLLQDTTAFLQLIEKNKRCSPETILVTLDVCSLYTNIPHTEGAEWVSVFYEETLHLWHEFADVITPIDKVSLQTLMLFILQNCTFEFNDSLYRQNYGTTMGARFSVKFANIYICICGLDASWLPMEEPSRPI